MHKNEAHKFVAAHAAQQFAEKGTVSMSEAAEASGYEAASGSHIAKSSVFRKAFFYDIDVEMVVKMQKIMFYACKLCILVFGVGLEREELKTMLEDEQVQVVAMEGSKESGWRILYRQPDYKHVQAALDTYYKLAGEYAPEKHQINVRPLEELSDDELERMVQNQVSQQQQATVEVIS